VLSRIGSPPATQGGGGPLFPEGGSVNTGRQVQRGIVSHKRGARHFRLHDLGPPRGAVSSLPLGGAGWFQKLGVGRGGPILQKKPDRGLKGAEGKKKKLPFPQTGLKENKKGASPHRFFNPWVALRGWGKHFDGGNKGEVVLLFGGQAECGRIMEIRTAWTGLALFSRANRFPFPLFRLGPN